MIHLGTTLVSQSEPDAEMHHDAKPSTGDVLERATLLAALCGGAVYLSTVFGVMTGWHGYLAGAPGHVLSFKLSSALPSIEIRTILVGLHLFGFCFGIGGATMLDFWILRWMRWGHLPSDVVRTFEFVSKVVSLGLILLWISGIGFLILYGLVSPEKLGNPKIAAKVIIVLCLTINGIVLHRLVLPHVARSAAKPLLHEEAIGNRILFVTSGAVSGVSWYAAFALGLLREFNGHVAATTILTYWLQAMVAIGVGTGMALAVFGRFRSTGSEPDRPVFPVPAG